MEEVIWRFPLIASKIFEELDDFSLAKCKETSRLWGNFIDNEIFYKNRIKQMLADKVKEKGNLRGELSQIHAAAMCGQARIVIDLSEQEVVKNPPNDRKITPLHLAAENGFLSICKYIVERTDDKNPPDELGRTPLHFAALNGHLQICKLIIEELIRNSTEDKNPQDYRFGNTPLHNAASNGHVEICKLITENVIEKNPHNNSGTTPFYTAASWGKAEVLMFLMENVGEEYVNERDICGKTPLEIAQIMIPPEVVKRVQDKYFSLKRARILRTYLPKRWKKGQSAVKALKAFGRVSKKRPKKIKKSSKIFAEENQ